MNVLSLSSVFIALQAEDELVKASAASNVADARVVKKRYDSGCSVRLLHPQQWMPAIAQLLAPLEQLLQCCLGCNVYLTPASSQVCALGIMGVI
jgi:hypothetical protein